MIYFSLLCYLPLGYCHSAAFIDNFEALRKPPADAAGKSSGHRELMEGEMMLMQAGLLKIKHPSRLPVANTLGLCSFKKVMANKLGERPHDDRETSTVND